MLNEMKDIRLTESVSDTDVQEDLDNGLRSRLDRLEREGQENRQVTERRIILAELKVEAIRAGILDLDGLKFLDVAEIHLEPDGDFLGGTELIGQLKRAKPWLFSASSSSSIAKVPPSGPARQKLATAMTDAEYRIARANIIKRSAI